MTAAFKSLYCTVKKWLFIPYTFLIDMLDRATIIDSTQNQI